MPHYDYELKIPLDRDGKEHETLKIKEVDEPSYMAANTFIQQGQELKAVKMLLKTLTVEGDPDKVITNFVALRSASVLLADLLEPVPGELKKNSNGMKSAPPSKTA